MNRHLKRYRLAAFAILVCFLTPLTGVTAGGEHDCCGNCASSASQHPIHTRAGAFANDCCPVDPACACSLESDRDRDLASYAIAYVSTICIDQADKIVSGMTRPGNHRHNHWKARLPRLAEKRTGPGPLYLTNQSFLC